MIHLCDYCQLSGMWEYKWECQYKCAGTRLTPRGIHSCNTACNLALCSLWIISNESLLFESDFSVGSLFLVVIFFPGKYHFHL